MTKIVNIDDYRKQEPYDCKDCGGKMHLESAIGLLHLGCDCGYETMVCSGHFDAKQRHISCVCGNIFLCVTDTGAYCPRCGHDFIEDSDGQG